jgi:predicted nucleic acid-binding Zn ribbon protein
MPEYEFKDVKTGARVLIVMPMADAVPIGEVREMEGRVLKRMASSGVAFQDKGFKPFVSTQPRKWHPHAPRHDPTGKPVFNNQQELADFAGKCNDDPNEKFSYQIASDPGDRPGMDAKPVDRHDNAGNDGMPA